MDIIITLLVGAAAGWLGSTIYKGSGLGILGNIVVGIIGSALGSWILGELNIHLGAGLISIIITGTIGAIVILFLFNLIFKKKR